MTWVSLTWHCLCYEVDYSQRCQVQLNTLFSRQWADDINAIHRCHTAYFMGWLHAQSSLSMAFALLHIGTFAMLMQFQIHVSNSLLSHCKTTLSLTWLSQCKTVLSLTWLTQTKPALSLTCLFRYKTTKLYFGCTVSITTFYAGLWHEMYMLWLYQCI